MGKRYHCLYCDSFLAATPNAIRTHCTGLAHQRLRIEHYNRYKDAESILKEERNKKPCSRFVRGECLFGGLCHFSHYTRDQIQQLQQQVTAKSQSKENLKQPSFQALYERLQTEKSDKVHCQEEGTTVYYDKNGQTTLCSWSYPVQLEVCQDNLPPSLKKIQLEDFCNVDIWEWG